MDAVSFGVAVLFLRSVRAREMRGGNTADRRLLAEIRDGLRFVAGDPCLRTLTAFSVMSNVALVGYQSIQVVFLARNLGAGAGQAGAVLALAGAGGLCGAVLAGRVATRFGTARGFLLCEAFAAPMLLLGPIRQLRDLPGPPPEPASPRVKRLRVTGRAGEPPVMTGPGDGTPAVPRRGEPQV
ncbi:hypothetical protein [Streptosporangium sp. OZ121]|uniref:hypothetical protein n=1 Tax=Streptosporangium sp. OZ121 TaxID=3444183 RepID=UPI003F7A3A00